MKPIDTISHRGCTINVHIDQCAENPFESWDCEPPIATYYGGRHGYYKAYGEIYSLHKLVSMLPAETWKRGNRVEFIREHLPEVTMEEFAFHKWKNWLSLQDTFTHFLLESVGLSDSENPTTWREATDYFDLLETFCKLAGVACYNGQSDGYSQGDSTLVFVMATPEWAKTVGAPKESLADQCKGAFDLFGQWAWGDVYGYTLEDGEGEELDDSCWGFYGSDHEESGLLESAQNAIDCHLERQAKEAKELEQAFTFA